MSQSTSLPDFPIHINYKEHTRTFIQATQPEHFPTAAVQELRIDVGNIVSNAQNTQTLLEQQEKKATELDPPPAVLDSHFAVTATEPNPEI